MEFSGEVELFPGEGGWYFVRMDPQLTDGLPAERGLTAVTVTIGDHSWPTSLMPLKGGSTFLPLSAPVRRRLGLVLGDLVTGTFELRER